MKILILLSLLLVSCSNSGDERLSERAELEENARIQAEEQRAEKLVNDLIYQNQFYEALYGQFEGEIETKKGTIALNLTLVPHYPIYVPKGRKLTVREAEEMLLGLGFDVQALVVLDPKGLRTAAGCQFEAVRGDLNKGLIQLFEEECANIFSLAINDVSVNRNKTLVERYKSAINGESALLSRSILAGDVVQINELVGEMRPSRRANVYSFSLKRVQ